jgi:hypothetical protein
MSPLEPSILPIGTSATRSRAMTRIQTKFQRGQSIAEFLIAMIVAVPLVLGIIYVGKYEDVKYTAIQASRYAIFERAFDTLPTPHESATDLTNETTARFFVDPGQLNQNQSGAVAFQDKPPGGNQTGGTLNPNWIGVDGKNVIDKYQDIQVTVQNSADLTGIGKTAYDVIRAGALTNINDPGIQSGRVQVKLADVANFSPLHGLGLNIDVSTAMLVDGFNADGNGDPNNPDPNSVRGRASLLSKANSIAPGLNQLNQVANNSILQWGWQGVSDTDGPNLFCVAPDVVPLDATDNQGLQYDPSKVCN